MTYLPNAVALGEGPPQTSTRVAPMWDGTKWIADGVPRIVRCPFAFDTPAIRTGAPLWTPVVGDLILDLWVEIITAWNGTTPLGDVGINASDPAPFTGWFGINGGPFAMTPADPGDNGLVIGSNLTDLVQAQLVASASNMLQVAGAGPGLSLVAQPLNQGTRFLPANFPTTEPVRVLVTQTGVGGGADPGSTHGSGALYLQIATPATG